MIKRLLKMVELTRPEQRVVICGLGALLVFVALKAHRNTQPELTTEVPAADVHQPSPSPGIRP